MMERFTSRGMRRAPDQTTFRLNKMANSLDSLNKSLTLKSEDGSVIIVIGQQPINPTTHKPYEFGIWKYAVKGDRLEPIGEIKWS